MDSDELEFELDRLHKASFGWALRCCAWNPAEAEDVLQIAYLKILEGKARFDGRSSLKTWLFAIIRRTAMEQRRRAFFRDLLLRKFNSRNGSSPDPVQATPDSLTFQLKKLPTRQQEVPPGHSTGRAGCSRRGIDRVVSWRHGGMVAPSGVAIQGGASRSL